MSFAASAAQGAQFKIGSPLVLVEGVQNMPKLAEKKDRIEITSISDTSRQYLAKPLRDYDPFDLELAYDPDNTQHMALLAAYDAQSTVAGQLTTGSGETLTGTFLVLSFSVAGEEDDPDLRILSMQATGTITRA